MTVTNNKQNIRYLFYRVGGIPKSVKFGPTESVILTDLTSTDQIIYNSLDYKLFGINARFGTTFPLDFTTAATDYHLLDTWYASLAVKPSAGLWTDLQTLANGMYADGDWSQIDLFGLIAGMETDEQRLRPLITTSGNDFLNVSGVTLSISGATGNGTNNYLDLRWNPTTNGVAYTDNADSGLTKYSTIAAYQMSMGSTATTQMAAMGVRTSVVSGSLTQILKNTLAGVNDNFVVAKINNTGFNAIITDSNPISYDAITCYPYDSDAGTNITIKFKNGVTNSDNSGSTGTRPSANMYGCAHNNVSGGNITNFSNKTQGMFLAGGNVNHTNVMTRVSTFFHARGVPGF